MFKSLKLYSSLRIDSDGLLGVLVNFGYKNQQAVAEEGDFSHRGGIVDIFPTGFEYPIRIELDSDAINSIHSFEISKGKNIWPHQIVIILPFKRRASKSELDFTEEIPLSN
ncbi:MAG: hypothetical protein Q8N14_00030, partial [Candidatus Omnitrophota bacterium]|nr:hypothetical protein [Candidatus Omnitrophota bacterium]